MSMKLSNFKASIDAYFDKADPDELVKRFEEYGCKFFTFTPNRNAKQTTKRGVYSARSPRKRPFLLSR